MKNLVFLTFFLLISVRLFADDIGPTKEIYYDNNTETYVAKDISTQSNIDYILYSIAAFAFAFLIWIYIRERRKE
jgi:hypothetical protein